jgi:hypothetical protein
VLVPHGDKTLQGKDAFDADIVNEGFEGRRSIATDRLIGEGNTVVCTGGADPPELWHCLELEGSSGCGSSDGAKSALSPEARGFRRAHSCPAWLSIVSDRRVVSIRGDRPARWSGPHR